jgi:hypothetical protein
MAKFYDWDYPRTRHALHSTWSHVKPLCELCFIQQLGIVAAIGDGGVDMRYQCGL